MARVTKVSGITLKTTTMSRAVAFYRDVLGLRLLYGGEKSSFSSFDVDGTYLNLEQSSHADTGWGRIIFYCDDVDGLHRRLEMESIPAPEPRDAPWNERFFHIKDPDGHELSMARPLTEPRRRDG